MSNGVQIVRQQEQSEFVCSACGAGSDCDCHAPGLRRTSDQTIAAREAQQRWREKAKQKQRSVDDLPDVENVEESPAASAERQKAERNQWAVREHAPSSSQTSLTCRISVWHECSNINAELQK
jgi:hypothetical protein